MQPHCRPVTTQILHEKTFPTARTSAKNLQFTAIKSAIQFAIQVQPASADLPVVVLESHQSSSGISKVVSTHVLGQADLHRILDQLFHWIIVTFFQQIRGL